MADEIDLSINMDGGSIGDKISESLKNVNIGTLMKNMLENVQIVDEDTEEAKGKLQDIMEKYNSMSAEERDEFTRKVKEVLTSRLKMKLQDPDLLKNLGGFEEAMTEAVMYRLYMLATIVVLVVIFVVFIGYKLYKSIKEKEIKKEEKKKLKQMKKKK